MEKTKVAIVGLGTVGTGVARLLLDYGDRTARHAGRTLWLEQVVVKDVKKPRDVDLPAGLLSDDLTRITRDPEIKVVASLIGGLEPARTIMLKLLESGKDIVTANKALLAEHGPELFDRARELGRSIAFEAAVAGGIPIIANISQCLSANQISRSTRILNGTSNFILTQMEEHGTSYAEAVAEAQRLGYAEADPTMDVDGSDAAQKLAILAHLAFGARIHWREHSAARHRHARRGRPALRPRAGLPHQAAGRGPAGARSGLELHVSPTLVKIGTPLAEVRGAYNAISVVGDAVGPLFFSRPGGRADADRLGRRRRPDRHGRRPHGDHVPHAGAVVAPRGAVVPRATTPTSPGRFYLRFNVEDRPGVLAEITGVLGRHGISIASVIQHEAAVEASAGVVPLVIMTHHSTEGATRRRVAEIDRLACVRPTSVRMRVQSINGDQVAKPQAVHGRSEPTA